MLLSGHLTCQNKKGKDNTCILNVQYVSTIVQTLSVSCTHLMQVVSQKPFGLVTLSISIVNNSVCQYFLR